MQIVQTKLQKQRLEIYELMRCFAGADWKPFHAVLHDL